MGLKLIMRWPISDNLCSLCIESLEKETFIVLSSKKVRGISGTYGWHTHSPCSLDVQCRIYSVTICGRLPCNCAVCALPNLVPTVYFNILIFCYIYLIYLSAQLCQSIQKLVIYKRVGHFCRISANKSRVNQIFVGFVAG